MPDFLFNYSVKDKTHLSAQKGGYIIVLIVLLSVVIPFNIFIYLAIAKKQPEFFYLAGFFFLLIILFGPYRRFAKNYFLFALSRDGILSMKSIINFIPYSIKINAKDLYYIKNDNPIKSSAVLFHNRENIVIARFNPGMMPYKTFIHYLEMIKEFSPLLRIEVSPQRLPENFPYDGNNSF